MTFDKSLEQFNDYLHQQDRSRITIKNYLHDLRQFARWFEQTNGRLPTPETITPTDVKEYRAYMQTVRGYKPTTINRRLRSLRAYCRWAVEAGHITADPTAGIREVRQQRLGPKALDRTETYRLTRTLEERRQWALNTKGAFSGHAVRATRDLAIVTLLLHTGLRISELAGLKLSDVEMSERKGSLTVAGKGNKQRQVPLNADARKALQRWLEVRPKVESEALFVGRGGVPLGTRGVQAVLTDLGRRAQVEGLHPHVLRHTFATRYLEANPGDLVGLATILGHESLETLRIYTVPNSDRLANKVEKLAVSDE
ncbi:MAG: tyrosine-type recombinase/integrase [candidate division KSB1 bacterium]|nr:tyrosine-type recombinase/integrase [candidate division KSB1 bacterium]